MTAYQAVEFIPLGDYFSFLLLFLLQISGYMVLLLIGEQARFLRYHLLL